MAGDDGIQKIKSPFAVSLSRVQAWAVLDYVLGRPYSFVYVCVRDCGMQLTQLVCELLEVFILNILSIALFSKTPGGI